MVTDSESLPLERTNITSYFYRDTWVWRGKTLSAPASLASADLSATSFDMANNLLTVFVKHVLCSSMEA